MGMDKFEGAFFFSFFFFLTFCKDRSNVSIGRAAGTWHEQKKDKRLGGKKCEDNFDGEMRLTSESEAAGVERRRTQGRGLNGSWRD